MSDYFARRMREGFQRDPDSVPLEDIIVKVREVGFDFEDDAAALEHFLSEVEELKEIYMSDRTGDIGKEIGDVELMLFELARRKGIDIREVDSANRLKYLNRLCYIEERLEEQRLSWADCDYETQLYPLWDEAKKAGL